MSAHIMRILALVVQFIAQAPRKLFPTYTSATMPNAALHPWAIVVCSDVVPGGALIRSTGTRWVPLWGDLTLANFNTDISVGNSTNFEPLRQITVPGWLMGPNDGVESEGLATITASTGSKTINMTIGPAGALVGSFGTATSTIVTMPFKLSFTNSDSRQSQVGSGGGIPVVSTVAVQKTTVDTSVDFVVAISGRKSVAGEVLTLNRVKFIYKRGVD